MHASVRGASEAVQHTATLHGVEGGGQTVEGMSTLGLSGTIRSLFDLDLEYQKAVGFGIKMDPLKGICSGPEGFKLSSEVGIPCSAECRPLTRFTRHENMHSVSLLFCSRVCLSSSACCGGGSPTFRRFRDSPAGPASRYPWDLNTTMSRSAVQVSA